MGQMGDNTSFLGGEGLTKVQQVWVMVPQSKRSVDKKRRNAIK